MIRVIKCMIFYLKCSVCLVHSVYTGKIVRGLYKVFNPRFNTDRYSDESIENVNENSNSGSENYAG